MRRANATSCSSLPRGRQFEQSGTEKDLRWSRNHRQPPRVAECVPTVSCLRASPGGRHGIRRADLTGQAATPARVCATRHLPGLTAKSCTNVTALRPPSLISLAQLPAPPKDTSCVSSAEVFRLGQKSPCGPFLCLWASLSLVHLSGGYNVGDKTWETV